MNNIQTTAIIRNRGQLTIPDVIRRAFNWMKTESVVKITYHSPQEIVITPYIQENVKKTDWKKIWAAINKARSFKGKRGNLSKFIAKDRYNH
ncbi:MAG: hypothetical protein AAB437_01410 [Patescibacteria group bacterium]